MTPEETAAAAKVTADAAAAATAKQTADAATAAAAAAAAAAAGTTTAQTPEQKAAADAAAAAAVKKAPAKYELKLPAGEFFDAADQKALEEIARANDWTQDETQAELDYSAQQRAAQSARFLEETTAHTEVGGDKLPAVQGRIKTLVDKFLPAGTPEGDRFRLEMTKNGYGNWPPFVVLMNRLAEAAGEDGIVHGRSAGGGGNKKSDADAMFGDMPGVEKPK